VVISIATRALCWPWSMQRCWSETCGAWVHWGVWHSIKDAWIAEKGCFTEWQTDLAQCICKHCLTSNQGGVCFIWLDFQCLYAKYVVSDIDIGISCFLVFFVSIFALSAVSAKPVLLYVLLLHNFIVWFKNSLLLYVYIMCICWMSSVSLFCSLI